MKRHLKAVAVMSVKGGTGKSLVSCNLALELAKTRRVALLDADVDSPNVPEMLGVPKDASIGLRKDRIMVPVKWKGLRIWSVGLFAGRVKSITKPGEEHRNILGDAIKYTDWGDAEVLVVDLPAGSSDEFIAVRETFGTHLLGVILVTLPNTIDDAERVYQACSRFGLRILGVVENMSHFGCHECGTTYFPLGKPSAALFADNYGLSMLGTIPLSAEISAGVARGDPVLPDFCNGVVLHTVERIVAAMGVN